MVSAPFVLSQVDAGVLPSKTCSSETSQLQISSSFVYALIIMLLTVATIFAPERPGELASICEKHHSAIACRVW